MKNSLIEKLAEIKHDRWSGQALTATNNLVARDKMTPEWQERWLSLANMPYSEFPEEKKEEIREQIRQFLDVIYKELYGLLADDNLTTEEAILEFANLLKG